MMRPGKHEGLPTRVVLPPASYFLSDARNILTFLASSLYRSCVARGSELSEALKGRLKDDGESLNSIYKEMNKLRSAYNRFRDLTEQERTIRERALRLYALLGSELSQSELGDIFADDVATIGSLQEIRDRTSLWEVIAVVLEQAGEIRVFELDMLLTQFNIKTTRQAIESAIDTHRAVFSVRKKGREKYVSLRKGA